MKFIENKEAVSPVVGVMLMLVVTLIIAGVVSAFGGGLVSTSTPTPQASIGSSLTYEGILKVTHNGGDTITGSAMDVKAKIISGSYVDMVSDVIIKNSTLARTNSSVTKDKFQTGDVFTVKWNDVFPIAEGADYTLYPSKGDVVQIIVVDKNNGNQISSSTATVQ